MVGNPKQYQIEYVSGANSPINVTTFPRFHLTYPGLGSRPLVTHIETERDHGYLLRGALRAKMDL